MVVVRTFSYLQDDGELVEPDKVVEITELYYAALTRLEIPGSGVHNKQLSVYYRLLPSFFFGWVTSISPVVNTHIHVFREVDSPIDI